MTKADKVAIRYDDKRDEMVLFFVNSNERGWWLECYSRAEGHSEASRGYMRRLKPVPPDQQWRAERLAQHWASIPGGPSSVVIASRLSGPRGDVGPYIGRE